MRVEAVGQSPGGRFAGGGPGRSVINRRVDRYRASADVGSVAVARRAFYLRGDVIGGRRRRQRVGIRQLHIPGVVRRIDHHRAAWLRSVSFAVDHHFNILPAGECRRDHPADNRRGIARGLAGNLRQRGWNRGINRQDKITGGGDVPRQIQHPHLVNVAAVGQRAAVGVSPLRTVGGEGGPGRAAVEANLRHFAAGKPRPQRTGQRERGIAGDKVSCRTPRVGADAGDGQHLRRVHGVDQRRLAAGCANVARQIDHPHLPGGGAVGERTSVNITPVEAVCCQRHVYPGCAVVGTDLCELISPECCAQYAAHGKRGVAGNKIAAAGSGVIADTGNGDAFRRFRAGGIDHHVLRRRLPDVPRQIHHPHRVVPGAVGQCATIGIAPVGADNG